MNNRKFCIKRTEGNYDIVNDFFNKVYNTKKYNGKGKDVFNRTDYLHYPPLKFGSLKNKVVNKFKSKFHEELTIFEAMKLFPELFNQ